MCYYKGVNGANQNSGHKRSALLLDKLMYALQKAIDEKEQNSASYSVGASSRDQDGDSMNRGTSAGGTSSISEVN